MRTKIDYKKIEVDSNILTEKEKTWLKRKFLTKYEKQENYKGLNNILVPV